MSLLTEKTSNTHSSPLESVNDSKGISSGLPQAFKHLYCLIVTIYPLGSFTGTCDPRGQVLTVKLTCNAFRPSGNLRVSPYWPLFPSVVTHGIQTNSTDFTPQQSDTLNACGNVDGVRFYIALSFFSAKKRSRWRTTCHLQRWASGLETVLEVIQNVETAQCVSLSLSTASHRHNTELTQCSSQPSMFVKFTLCWKNVHMNPKMTDIPECSI